MSSKFMVPSALEAERGTVLPDERVFTGATNKGRVGSAGYALLIDYNVLTASQITGAIETCCDIRFFEL